MSVHLRLLALQSLRRIASELGLNIDVPNFFSLYGSPPKEFEAALERVSSILDYLMRNYGITWWDVYLKSDIGAERVLLVKELGLSREDVVLDVGYGRGYFSFAAAKVVKLVVGVDVMDYLGRVGWWGPFVKAVKSLGLEGKVLGVSADATSPPLRDSSFDVAVTAHSVRDFVSIDALVRAVKEMKRVVKVGGYVVLIENLPIAKNRAQENHLRLRSIRTKFIKNELRYLSKEELLRITYEAGFKDVEIKVVNYGLCSTPAIFYLSKEHIKEGVDPLIIKEYEEVIKSIKEIGEESPPTAIIKARK